MKKKKTACKDCETPLFCTRCGARLEVITKVYMPYSMETGERIDLHHHFWICPNHTIILGVFSRHSHFDDIPTGL